MLCGFLPQFFPLPTETFYLRKKKDVSGILCITPAEGLYLPSGGLFFSPSAGSSEGKGFQYFQIGMRGSPEELLDYREAKKCIIFK